MITGNNIHMYNPLEPNHKHLIEISCDGSISQVINLESSIDKDKAYFIKKFINTCCTSALIISNGNMLNDLKYPEWERDMPGIKGLSIHTEDIKKISLSKGRETTNIGIDSDLVNGSDILSLLATIHMMGKKGNCVLLIIDNLNYLSNRIGQNKDIYTLKIIQNALYYNPTLICDGFPLDHKLFDNISGITTTIKNVAEDSYDIIYNKNNEVFEDITLENIDLTQKHRDY